MSDPVLTPEQLRIVNESVEAEYLEPLSPIVELHGWSYDGERLWANEVRNHPRLGNAVGLVRTTRVLYFNREAKIAVTRNTVYVLFKEAQ